MDGTIERLTHTLIEAWNNHDVEQVAALCDPEYHGLDVAEAQPLHGPDGVRQSMMRYLEAFPDLRFTGIDVVIQDSRIAVRWTANGTHRGPLMNIPASGYKFSVSGTSFYTLGDGRFTHGICVWDVAGLLRAIGLLPRLQ